MAVSQLFAAAEAIEKQFRFLRFLHFSGLIVHFGQEPVTKGIVRQAGNMSNKPMRGISLRLGAIPEPDGSGSSRAVPVTEGILRTVFIQVCCLP